MKREEQRVFAGGLNVFTPSDKTPESDAIELLNFRVDQAGVLRMAERFEPLDAATTFFSAIHTLLEIGQRWSSPDGSETRTLGGPSYLLGAGTGLWLWTPGENPTFLGNGFDGQTLSIVVWNGLIWAMNQALQLVIQLWGQTLVTKSWLPAAPAQGPSVVLSLGPQPIYNGPNGTYQYYVTWVAESGLETNPSPASQSITVTVNPDESQNGVLITLPLAPDSTLGARIYRSGGTLGAAYQVTEISAGDTSIQYLDTASDLALTETGITMPGSDPSVGDNSPPPAALGVVGPYLNRLLAFNSQAKPNRMWWTQEGVPVFPGSGDPEIGNWVDVGAVDDGILAVTLHARTAIIYKQRSIWRLVGDAATGVLEQCSATVGTVGLRAVANAGPVDYFLSTDGLFLFDLDLEHKRSDKLNPIFYGAGYCELGLAGLPLHTWDPVLPVCAWLEGTVLISDGSGTAFLFHAETARFAPLQAQTGAAITAVSARGSAFDYRIGDSKGFVSTAVQKQLLPPGHIDPQAVWQTPFLDQGLGDQDKYYREIVLDIDPGGSDDVQVWLLFDNSGGAGSRQPLGGAIGTGRVKAHFSIPEGTGPQPHISVRVEFWGGVDQAALPAIHGLYLYYEVEARDTRVAAMRAIDFHSEWEKLARRIAIDASGSFVLKIYADSDTPAFTANVDTGGARKTVRLNLPPNLHGRRWRARVENLAGDTLRLYSLRAWMRTVGSAAPGAWEWEEWLAGTPAETPNAL